MTSLHEDAPAKINLGLVLGPTRADGRHELVTVMQPLSLCDRVRLEPAGLGAAADEVVCPGVEGDNLAAAVRYAQAAAAISVTRAGAQPSLPTAREVDEFLEERR